MIETITEHTFIDTMTKKDNGFSYDGASALFAYFEQLEEDCNISLDFDPIAIRCEWSEYKDLEELNKDYSHDYDFEGLCGDTQVIKVGEEGIIIQQF